MLLERQLRPVWTKKNSEKKERYNGVILWNTISEGRADAETINSPVCNAFLDDGTVCGPHEATRAFLTDFQKGPKDRDLQLNLVKCGVHPG